MADFEQQASLDVNDVIKGLRQINKEVDRTARETEKKFQQASKAVDGVFQDKNGRLRDARGRFLGTGDAASQAGRQIAGMGDLSVAKMGLIGGATAAITSKVIEFGAEAARAFGQAIGASVQLASQLETTEKIFIGIFQGNEEAATAALERIRKKGRELGVDLTELASAFLPQVESLEQFERVGGIAAALARAQPEQGAIGARIALQEALSGTFTSLQRRFEIPKSSIDKLRASFEEAGVEGLIGALEAELQRTGRDLETLGDTFQTSLAKGTAEAERFGAAFGGPIIDSAKEALDSLFAVLEENGDDLELVAAAFGDVVASVIDFAGSGLTDLLANLDTDQAIELALNFQNLVEDAKAFIGVLSGADIGSILEDVDFLVGKMGEALTTATQIAGLIKAEEARAAAEREASAQIVAEEQGGEGFLSNLARSRGVGDVTVGLTELLGTQENLDKIRQAGEAAYQDTLLKTVDALGQATEAKKENEQAIKDRAAAQKESTTTGEAAADAFLAEADRLRELDEARLAAADAQAAIDEKLQAQAESHQEKLDDIILQAELDRLDQQEKNARERIDIATENLRKIEDIERKNAQDIADAGTDLRRDEQDIARKFARERTDISKERAKDELKAEEDFQKELQSIRTNFAQAATEAERNRDAISFLEAVRQKDQAVEQARQERDEKVVTAKDEAQARREELRIQQEQELEDARITNERKLEDLRQNLDRQLEEQRINNERKFEDQTIAEARISEDFEEEVQRRLEAANLANQRKLEDLNESLAAEYEAVKHFNDLKVKSEEDATNRIIAIRRRLAATGERATGGEAGSSARPGLGAGFVPQQLDDGGVVTGGPRGAPKLVVAHVGETFIPTHRQPRASRQPLPAGASSIRSTDNSMRFEGDFNFGGGSRMDRFVTFNEFTELLRQFRGARR